MRQMRPIKQSTSRTYKCLRITRGVHASTTVRIIRQRHIKRTCMNTKVRPRTRLIHLIVRMKLRHRPAINRDILTRLVVTTRPSYRLTLNTMNRINSTSHSTRTNRQYTIQNMMITTLPIEIHLSHNSLSILNNSLIHNNQYTNNRRRYQTSSIKIHRRPLRHTRPTRQTTRRNNRPFSTRNINRHSFRHRLISSDSAQPTQSMNTPINDSKQQSDYTLAPARRI